MHIFFWTALNSRISFSDTSSDGITVYIRH